MTRLLPADVTRLVRECLRLHVGRRCPAWIDALMSQHMRGLEMDTYISMTVWATRSIDHAQNWAWFGMLGSEEEGGDARVTVELDVHRNSCDWKLTWIWGNTQPREVSKYNYPPAAGITRLLDEIRSYFACRRAESSGTIEVPSSWQEWSSFVSLWLFSQAPATIGSAGDACEVAAPPPREPATLSRI